MGQSSTKEAKKKKKNEKEKDKLDLKETYNAIEKWEQHVRTRRCSQCNGLSKAEHGNPDTSTSDQKGELTGESNTVLNESTNAFGVLKFPQSSNRAKFLRFRPTEKSTSRSKSKSSVSTEDIEKEVQAYMEDADDIYHLLTDVWGLEKPNILISVTGGTKNCKLDRDRKSIELFRRGLMQVVEGSKNKTKAGTGTWILTGGTDKGVAKEISEAVFDYSSSVHLIGFTTWGSINGKTSLLNKESGNENLKDVWQPKKYKPSASEQSAASQEVPVRPDENDQNKSASPGENADGTHDNATNKPNTAILDARHTHFLLVDSGTEGVFHDERQTRAMFEKYMRDKHGVLTVLVVLDGGPGTLQTVLEALENGIPVVVVKGSGRKADELAESYELIKERKTTENISNDNAVYKIVQQHYDLITVHDIDSKLDSNSKIDSKLRSSDIGISILYALEKGNKVMQSTADKKQQAKTESITPEQTQSTSSGAVKTPLVQNLLTLTLRWPKAEEVLREMFDKRNHEPDFDINQYKDTVKDALIQNRPNIVEAFIDFGFSIQDFLTRDMLLELYKAKVEGSILDERLQRAEKKSPKTKDRLLLLDVVMKDFLDKDFKFTYRPPVKKDEISKKINRWLKEEKDGKKSYTKLKLPAHDLFIWAILSNYQSMAKMLWEKGKLISSSHKDSIALALVGHSLLRAMARKTDDNVLRRQLKDQANEFSLLASGVLEACYEQEEQLARDLVVRVIPHLGVTTCINIAISTRNRYFISTHACQTLLVLVWHGKLSFETDGNWAKGARLVIGCIFPLIVPLLMNFKKDKMIDEKEKRQTKNTGKENGQKNNKVGAVNASEQQTQSTKDSEKTKKKKLTLREKYKYFFQAPITVYTYHTLSYLFFLSLYSYILVVQMKFYEATREDYLLFAWVISFIVEEIRQIYLSVKYRRSYWDIWNCIDWFGIAVFTIGMSLRQVNNEIVYGIARAFLCVDVIIFYARLLQMFLAVRELGPKLLMIGRMFRDLAYFIVILMVFVVSYAVASHSLLYPNSQLSIDTVLNVFRRPYWNLYGELFLETVEGTEECTVGAESTRDRCPTSEGIWTVPILMGFYVMAVNILLLNLLIAMFSYTFQNIQDNTDAHWHYLRYSMIYEYYDKPWLFPPLTLITRLLMFLLSNREDHLRKEFDDRKNDDLSRWENVQTMKFLHQKNEKSDDELKTSLDILIDKVQHNLEEDRRAEGTGSMPQTSSRPKTAVPSRQPQQKGSGDSDKKVAEMKTKVDSLESSVKTLQFEIQNKVKLLEDVARKLDKKAEELGKQQQPRVSTDGQPKANNEQSTKDDK